MESLVQKIIRVLRAKNKMSVDTWEKQREEILSSLDAALRHVIDFVDPRTLYQNLQDAADYYTPQEIKDKVEVVKDPEASFWERVSAFAEVYVLNLGAVWGEFRSNYMLLQYASARHARPSRLAPGEIMAIEGRDQEPGFKNFREDLMDLGYSETRIAHFEEMAWRDSLVGPAEQIAYWLRKGEGWSIDQHLKEKGLNKDSVSILKELSKVIPGVSDLINMAVREAFDDSFAATWGADEQFEKVPIEATRAQGLSDEWAKAYWRAHWLLPSVGQAFAMLQRRDAGDQKGVIDEGELDQLLTALDIMPGWRENLKKIAYNPLTRVDVRRIQLFLGKDKAWLLARYQDVGFDAANAEIMADFTLAYNTKKEKDLTQTQILKRLDYAPEDHNSVRSLLIGTGLDKWEADWLIQNKLFHVEEDARSLAVGQLKKIYLAFPIQRDYARGELSIIGYSADGINQLTSLWDTELAPKTRHPTKADLTKWQSEGIITAQEYVDRLADMGYDAWAQSKYLLANGGDPKTVIFQDRTFVYQESKVKVNDPNLYDLQER